MKPLSVFLALILLISAALSGCSVRKNDSPASEPDSVPEQETMTSSMEQSVTVTYFIEPEITESVVTTAQNTPDSTETTAENQSDTTSDDTYVMPPDGVIDFTYDYELTPSPIYDTSAILEAYRTGNTSSLSEKDFAIYNEAVKIIEENCPSDMSDEDAVITIHDYLVTHIQYDLSMLSLVPTMSHDANNPYGALISGQAICMGYTSTFKLLMDMLGIRCLIVRGDSEGEEHAWNMVCLDEKWYHVDVTWDDFVPDDPDRPALHPYLLVPDSVIESPNCNHRWNRDAAPKATASDRIYYLTHDLLAESSNDCYDLLKKAYYSGTGYAEIMFYKPYQNKLTFDFATSYWAIEFNDYTAVIFWLEN